MGARDGLPHEEFRGGLAPGAEECAAVAAVDGPPGAEVRDGGEGEGRVSGGGDEAWGFGVDPVVEEAEHGGCGVELVEAAAEPGTGDGDAPGLADKGAAEEAGWIVGREAQENLLDYLVGESRRRRCCHGTGLGWFGSTS